MSFMKLTTYASIKVLLQVVFEIMRCIWAFDIIIDIKSAFLIIQHKASQESY